MRSPKRVCADYRSVLVERNSFTSPVKDRFLAFNNLKSKLPPPLQSAFARYQHQSQEEAYIIYWHHIIFYFSFFGMLPKLMLSLNIP